jgi:hypothetical protein
MTSQTTLNFNRYVVYDLWAKENHPARSRMFPTTQNEIRNPSNE